MAYGRNSVLSGETIDLRVVFTDDAGNLVDPDAGAIPVPPPTLPAPVLIQVYIYDESVDTDVIEAEIAASTFTSALDGPFTPTRIATGFYEYSYTVPTSSDEGLWHDVWVSQVDGVDSNQLFEFTVDVGADLTIQQLLNNELILIELADSITNTAGDKSLASTITLSFMTVLSPFYASPDLVRMEAGLWLDFVPDSTLALMIHWSSKEVDFIAKTPTNSSDFQFARTKFVVADTVLRALTLPGGSNGLGIGSGGVGIGGRKTLGDLTIDNKDSRSNVAVMSSGVDVETMKYYRTQRDEWWRVVNAGGTIVPGQSFEPSYAIKGKYNPDRRNAGRAWISPDETYYLQPGVNTKIREIGRDRGRFTFDPYRTYTRGR